MFSAAMSETRAVVGVVGAGPAGTAAAQALAAANVAVEVFDEQSRPGGNIHRRRLDDPVTPLEKLAAGPRSTVRLHLGCAVLGIGPDLALEIAAETGIERHRFDAVFLCAGAYDTYEPLPGTPAPAVSTAGALQALLKGQGTLPRGRVVIAGTGPFLHIVAQGLIAAGADVTALVDRIPRSRYLALAGLGLAVPANAIEFARAFAALRRHGTRVTHGRSPRAVSDRTLVLDDGATLPFDRLGLTDSFVPQSQLARSAGCAQHYSPESRTFHTVADERGRTSVPGLYVCGEGQGIRGWRHAELSGRIAALDFLRDRGLGQPPALGDALLRLRAWRERRFAARLQAEMTRAAPRRYDPRAVVCACERVPVSAVETAVAFGLHDLSSIKSVTRCGMGPCQGRYCEPAICRVLAAAEHIPRAAFAQKALVRPVLARELAHGA